MIRILEKIFFFTLISSLLLSVFNCSTNDNIDNLKEITQTFFYDFENENHDSIWKNVNRVEDSSAFSGIFVSECKNDDLYSLGFDININDSIEYRNALISIDMMLKFVEMPSAMFVVSVMDNEENVFWKSFPLSDGFTNVDEWYKSSMEINLPNDVVKNSQLNCYILNERKQRFLIDNINLNINYYNILSYIDEIDSYSLPDDLENISKSDGINILYSNNKEKIVLADDNENILTNPLSMFYSLIVDNDTVEVQFADWKLYPNENQNTYVLKNDSDLLTVKLILSLKNDDPNVNISLNTSFKKDLKVIKSSLIIPFQSDDFILYRRNPFVDSCEYQYVYYLDNEGFSVLYDTFQVNLYHPENVSSIQFDTRNAMAFINTDFYYDHLLIRYELSDTSDCIRDNSYTFMKEGANMMSSFTISMTERSVLPRIMPVMDGYECAFIWTEHADWTDIRTHRATYFGSEDIEKIEDAVGGFAYYDIPVTKSVFYNNPDSVTNYEKNKDFPGLHSTIMTDSSFLDFLIQLRDNGFDVCLHTPEQYTTSRDNLSDALSFMKENFASPSWIDHGYNNSVLNNREDLVCDGLDSTSPYYAYDLWKKYDIRYLFNPSYEEMNPRPFLDYVFDNQLMRPYPGFGDAIPLPRYSSLPSHPEMLLWSTPYTLEPGRNWDYFLNQRLLDKIVDYRYVFITHFYAPWVDENRGFWQMENGKIVAKKGFNEALERISDLKKQRLMLPCTIADYMTYLQQIQLLEYKLDEKGNLILKNNNNETIKGLSLISTKAMSLGAGKSFNERKTKSGDEFIIWFDMAPQEVVKVFY